MPSSALVSTTISEPQPRPWTYWGNSSSTERGPSAAGHPTGRSNFPSSSRSPTAPSASDPRQTLAAAREALLAAVDQQIWTLTWTRDGGSPLVLDCFRAQPAVITYELAEEVSLVSEIELTFQALPYGRADQQVQVAFPVPVPGTSPPPPPSPVVLDTFASITGAQWAQSNRYIVGPYTAYWDPGAFPAHRPDGRGLPLTYAATLPAPVNLTGLTALAMWAGVGARSDYYCNLEWRGRTRAYVAFTLTDVNGTVLSCQSSRRVPCSQDVFSPAWTYVTAAIPQGSATFDYTQVAAYSVTITNRDREWRWCHAYIDALTAVPPSQQAGPVNNRGTVYRLAGIEGTSHAPVSLTFQQPPTAGSPSTLTGTGTYTVPPGAVALKVEATGGGGAGASMTTAGVGGGGGGGEYAREDALPVTPGQVIPYQCGIAGTAGASPVNGGDTTFGGGVGQLAVTAHGGQSAAQNSTTGAAGGTGSGNSVRFPGGAGRTASGSVGGGGGSSAGSTSAGLTPVGTSATTFTTAGTSTWTCPSGVTSVLAECWGGGGGGGSSSNSYYAAGAGGGGEYSAQTIAVTPTHSYSYTVGAGGSGGNGSSGGDPGSSGGNSVFAGDTTTVTAHAGGGGGVNSYNSGGSAGNGGSGSSNTTRHPGGDGGQGRPYAGGGGSSAGPSSAGNDGNGYGDPGTAPAGGGAGGAGRTGNGAGHAGSAPGGGGGASYNPGYTGGNGAAGQVRLTYPGGGAPTNTGAPAVVGGGAGGNGGPSANTAGSAGSAPGGGGGGADSTGTSEAGGSGGAGRIIVTPFASAAFKTLIAHRPGPDAPASLNPLVPVGNGADTPNGAPSTRYRRWSAESTPGSAGRIRYCWPTSRGTPRAQQPDYHRHRHASRISAAARPSPRRSARPSPRRPGSRTGWFVVGELTLPYKDIAPDNQSAVFTVSVTDTNSNDRFLDAIFLDTTGQTTIVSVPSGYVTLYADEPDPDRDLGRILGSQFGRPDAISVMDAATLSGGPLTVDPAQSAAILLVYSAEGSPAVAMSYFARFWIDRV